MADTNKTILNMLLQFRRDNVFTASYVLEKGEPGFEISTNTLKIGDGSTTWENLKIANKEVIDSLISAAISANNASHYTSAQVDQIKKDLQTALENAVDGLEGTITTLATKEELAAEVKTRGEEDVKLQNAIDTKLATETFNSHVNGDHAKTATEITAEIAAAVLVEENARKAADKAITDAIGTKDDAVTATTVYGTIAKTAADIRGEFADADADLKDYVDELIAAEQKTRGDADDALDGRLDVLEAINHDAYITADTKVLQDAKDYADETFVTKEGFNEFETAYEEKLNGIAAGAEVNVIESVKVNGVDATISNKAAEVTIDSTKIALGKDIVSDGTTVYASNKYLSEVLQGIQDSIAVAVSGGLTGVVAGNGIEVSEVDANKQTVSVKVSTVEGNMITADENGIYAAMYYEGDDAE
jgi:hypothetical protein